MMYLGFPGFLALLIVVLGVINLWIFVKLMQSLNKLKIQSTELFSLMLEEKVSTIQKRKLAVLKEHNE